MRLDARTIEDWLRTTDPAALAELWGRADAVRHEQVGDAVHLRGLVEMANHCQRRCAYCGLHRDRPLARYRLTPREVLNAARRVRTAGYGTLVLQAGEDPGLTCGLVAELVRKIKAETGLAVTLSLGERDDATYAAWREAGADRYLLRFETADRRLYAELHPGEPDGYRRRLGRLLALRQAGYEVGSGVMVGLPGQTWTSLAAALQMFADLDLDMIGLGPWIPTPETPLIGRVAELGAPDDEQVTADVETATRVLALARLLCPRTNIPATTALAVLDPERGYATALTRGANVIMPNLTPARYRDDYALYPGKGETWRENSGGEERLYAMLGDLGRVVATGPGHSPRYLERGGGLTQEEKTCCRP